MARELAIAVAGVGLGAAAVVLYSTYYKSPARKSLTRTPTVKIERHADQDLQPKRTRSVSNICSTVSAVPEVKAEAPSTPVKPSDSSSHLAAHHLSTWQDDEDTHTVWPRPEQKRMNNVLNPMAKSRPEMNFLNPHEKVQAKIIANDSKAKLRTHLLDGGVVRGNACKNIYWDPSQVKAALVTCGGLCPGLNNIIQGITHCLLRDYGVTNIVGVTAGYNGLASPEEHPSISLTQERVADIHMKGGSILKAARGGFDAPKICQRLREGGYTHLFVIGGDGTQFAGHLLYEECRKQKLQISVVGVPKSIDNDVMFVDKTFGFDSAVEAAAGVIRNGYVEATSCDKGVGIVKLMGRDAGWVAAHSALASNLVDLVLVPEVTVQLDDILTHVDDVIAEKGHMVIVVAEGAGQEHVATGKKDATGHDIYGDIGVFLRDTLNKYLKPKGGRTFYIDPSYIIRSVPATPNDHIYCARLANNAVHTSMRGYTGVCVGAIHNIIVILKSKLIAADKKKLKIKSSTWQTCCQVCDMPDNLTGMSQPAQPGY